ncbi:MAG: carboxypeptidase-like regulatory domain-containing protein [Planctomycetota bacterium]
MGRIGWGVLALGLVVGLLAWWLTRPGEQNADLAAGPAREEVSSGSDPLRTASGPKLEGVSGKAPTPEQADAPRGSSPETPPAVDPQAGYVIEGVVRELGSGLPLAADSLLAVVGRPPFTPTEELAVEARPDGSFRLELPGPTRRAVESWRFGVRELGVVGVVVHGEGETVAPVVPRSRAFGDPLPKQLHTAPSAVNHVTILAVQQFWLRGRILREDAVALDLDLMFMSCAAPSGSRAGTALKGLVPKVEAGGSFELGPFPEIPERFFDADELGARRGAMHFQVLMPGLPPRAIWPYGVPRDQRDRVEIVLGRRVTLTGRVVDPQGRSPAGASVILERRDGLPGRGHARTDADGTWRFSGLPPEPVVLTCRVPSENLMGTLRVDVVGDRDGLEIRLEPISLPAHIEGVSLFGLTLANVDARLREAWELPDNVYVVVVGVDEALRPPEVEVLVRGTGLSTLDGYRIRSVGELVERLERLVRDDDTEALRFETAGWTRQGLGVQDLTLPLTPAVLAEVRRAYAALGLGR